MTTREFSTKRQIIDYNHLETLDGQDVILCVPKVSVAIARVLLSTRALWRSTYSLGAVNDHRYEIPSLAQMDLVEEAIAEFLHESEDYKVSLCDDLSTGLSNLVDAVGALELSCSCGGSGAGACGEGSGGAGGEGAAPTEFEDDGIDPPPGFETYNAYKDFKCNMAEKIRLELVSDVTWVRDIDLISITATLFVAGLFTPIPGDEIVALVGFVLSLFLAGTLVGFCQEIISSLGTNAAAWRCALYDAFDVTEAMTDGKAALGLTPIAAAIFNYFVSTDSFNRLFVAEEIGDYGVDCTACDLDPLQLLLGSTTDDLVYDNDITITAVWSAPFYRAYLSLADHICNADRDWYVVSNTADDDSGSGAATYDWGVCPAQSVDLQWDKIPVGARLNQVGISQIDNSPFTIVLRCDSP